MRITPATGAAYRRHAQDGTGHLTYYRADLALSFVWDPLPTHPIEVEHGGYGELVVATLEVEESDLPTTSPASPHGWTVWFQAVCDGAIPAVKALGAL